MTDPYPQHAKLTKVKDESQAIGSFLDTIRGQGYHLMRWGTTYSEGTCLGCDHGLRAGREHEPCAGTGVIKIEREGWVDDHRTIEQILADYFEIDYMKLQAEKDLMLKEIRRINKET